MRTTIKRFFDCPLQRESPRLFWSLAIVTAPLFFPAVCLGRFGEFLERILPSEAAQVEPRPDPDVRDRNFGDVLFDMIGGLWRAALLFGFLYCLRDLLNIVLP